MLTEARAARDSITVEDKTPRYRWVMLALVWLVYLCFGMTGSSLAPLVDTISRDLGISSTEMGLVLGAWQLVYVGSAYPMGTLIDRLGVRRSVGLGIGIVTLSLALRSVAVDFYSLFFIVALHGIGGPIISIGAPKMVALWFFGRDRGLGTGIYNSGPGVGAILVLAATNSVVVPLTGHWRLSFLVYGVAALIATAIWWLLARDRPAADPPSEASPAAPQVEAAPSAIETFKSLLHVGNVRIVLLLAFAAFFLSHGLTQWLPTVFIDQGISPSNAGLLAAVPRIVGIPALLILPYRLHHGLRGRALVVLMIVSAVATLGIATLGGPALVGSLVVSGVARQMVVPMLTLVLMETPGVGRRHIGAAGGMFFAVAEIGGFTGPLFVGLLRDLTNTLTSGLVLLVVVSGTLAITAFFITEGHRER
ncbi:MAG: CynX/NimT family MFS transporter [Dehalococcoidia bacterium]